MKLFMLDLLSDVYRNIYMYCLLRLGKDFTSFLIFGYCSLDFFSLRTNKINLNCNGNNKNNKFKMYNTYQ